MDEEKEEELGNELQLIYIYRAISELPNIFPSLVKIVQPPYMALFQYAFDLYFTWGFPCSHFPLSLHDACEFCVVQGEVGGKATPRMASADSQHTVSWLLFMLTNNSSADITVPF